MLNPTAILKTFPNVKQVMVVNGRQVAYDWDGEEFFFDPADVQAASDAEDLADHLSAIRMFRDEKLSQSDWVVIKAQETGTAVPQEWIDYRQALRDITQVYTNINDVVWPDQPQE